MAGYTKTFTLDFTASGDTVYTGTDKLEDDIDSLIADINYIKKNYSSATAPTSPAPDEGQLWWDSTNDALYVYTGSVWAMIGVDTYKAKTDSSDSTAGYLDAKVQKSITVNATDHKMELSGDSATPGNSYFYGTSGAGAKGFQSFSTALASELDDYITHDMIKDFAITRGVQYYNANSISLSSTTEVEIGTITAVTLTNDDSVFLWSSAELTTSPLNFGQGKTEPTIPVTFRVRKTSTTGSVVCSSRFLVTSYSYGPIVLVGSDIPGVTGNQVYKLTATQYAAPTLQEGGVSYRRLMGIVRTK
jgi:hypothetical protein